MGEKIRYPACECIAVDPSKPVGQVAYQISADEYVMQVPEMRYTSGASTIFWNVPTDYLSGREWASEAEPTGKMRWVKVKQSSRVTNLSPTLLDEPPNIKGAKKIDAAKLDITKRKPDYNPCYDNTEPSTMQCIAAAPFDYLIDPIASVPLTIGTYGIVVLGSPIILYNIWFSCNQEQEIPPVDPPQLEPIVLP